MDVEDQGMKKLCYCSSDLILRSRPRIKGFIL